MTTAGFVPVRHVLGNGLTVLAAATRTVPAVSVHVAVKAGSMTDPPGLPGLSHLLARTLDRGTTTRSPEEIADLLDGRGVSLSASPGVHTFSLSCTCLSDDLPEVIALLADVLRAPAFPVQEVEQRRREVVTALRQEEDTPVAVAHERLVTLLYGRTHPYGRPVQGTVDTVEQVTLADLRRHHAAHVTPGRTTFTAVGDADPAAVCALVSEAFETWEGPSSGAAAVPPVSQPVSRQTLVVPMMGKSQVELAYGFLAVPRLAATYDAAWVMNVVLGQYALGGRLGDRIRERDGMAYHVSSTLDAGVVEGPLVIRAGVGPADVERAIGAIEAEIGTLVEVGPTTQEVDDAIGYLVGALPRYLETNQAIAGFLQMVEFFELGLDYHHRLAGHLRAVTREDVHRAARDVLVPARAAVVAAGPYDGPLV